MRRLVIKGRLPGMNEYINYERSNRYQGSQLKRKCQDMVGLAIKSQLRGYKAKAPVILHYTWFEPSRKRDKDNICGFGHKVIQDALVKAGVLENDGWEYVDGFTDNFAVDKKNPRIVVDIEEIQNLER